MRVKCIENKVNSLSKNILDNYLISYSNFPVVIMKEYVVYGMILHLGIIWYYIADENFSYYPVWKPSLLFEVSNGQLSRYWIYAYEAGDVVITFPEWARYPDFYDKLIDGEKKEVEIFKTYKELMDLEFSDPAISTVAQVGDNEWLICPTCIDAWQESDDLSALVRCSKCRMIMHNPRYQSKKALM